MNYLPQKTIRYKTYLKQSCTGAMRQVFENHIDAPLQEVKTTIDFPRTRAQFPAIVVRFFEREIRNSGVGHQEWLLDEETGTSHLFKHYQYVGDIEFGIYALTSLDRDLISDSVVQTITMGSLEAYTNSFYRRIYPTTDEVPDSLGHYVNINSDKVTGFGETQSPVPWQSEDDLIYQTAYRVAVFGEFYSVPPTAGTAFISKVIQYPYIGGLEAIPEGDPTNGNGWSTFV